MNMISEYDINAQLTMTTTYRFSTIYGAKKQKRFNGFVIQVTHDHVILLHAVEELFSNIWS